MDIYKVLRKKSCSVSIEARTKEAVLEELAELAAGIDERADVPINTIAKKLKEREAQGSTGFGNELAIPHARIKGLKGFILYIAISKNGVDFESLDKKKVKVFFVILAPEEKVNEHLKILASVSRTFSHTKVKKELLQARNGAILYESFVRNSQGMASAESKTRTMKLMYVILYIDEFLNDILELFIQEGIEGATIINSSGMGEYISNIPLFATFIGFMNQSKASSQTIMAVIPEELESVLIEGVEEVIGDLDKKQGAMVFTTEISNYKGTMRMM